MRCLGSPTVCLSELLGGSPPARECIPRTSTPLPLEVVEAGWARDAAAEHKGGKSAVEEVSKKFNYFTF